MLLSNWSINPFFHITNCSAAQLLWKLILRYMIHADRHATLRRSLHYSLLLGAAPLLLRVPPAFAVPTCLLLDSTLRDTCDTMPRGTSCGRCSHAPPSTTSVSPLTNLQQRQQEQLVMMNHSHELSMPAGLAPAPTSVPQPNKDVRLPLLLYRANTASLEV
jgi:hypothetical protein